VNRFGQWKTVAVAFAVSAIVVVFAAGHACAAEADSPVQSPQVRSRQDEGPRRVFKDRINAHWFTGNTRFWYRNDLAGGAQEFVLVDAEKGTRVSAFDHGKLAAALSRAAGAEYAAARLPVQQHRVRG
jgi:hypothetical protein